MRILIITTEFPPMTGGIATLGYEQARGLAAQGNQVEVVTAQTRQIDVQDEPFALHNISTCARAIVRLLPFTFGLCKAIRRFRPDFLWCPTYRGFGMPVALLSCVLGIPYGIYLHGTEVNTESKRSARRFIMKSILNGAHILIYNSRNTHRLVGACFPDAAHKGAVVTPGVDFARITDTSIVDQSRQTRVEWDRLFGLSSEGVAVYCLSLCRMVRTKGIDVVLSAIASLEDDYEFVYYVVAGGGPDLEYFKALAKELKINHRILFLGAVEYHQASQILNAADIYVQPSQPIGDFLESFGISFLEAQAAGLPCIGSDWGGVPEAVIVGKTAVLVSTGEVDPVARAIVQLAGDAPRRNSMGEAGRAWAAENSWAAHSAKLDAAIGNGRG